MDTATTEIYTLSLHDALPIWHVDHEHVVARKGTHRAARKPIVDERHAANMPCWAAMTQPRSYAIAGDRKSTRLNSSLVEISYAVFCLKKKKKTNKTQVLNTQK